MLCINLQAFERASNEHLHYWDWRKHRNESRWKAQEKGHIDYDAKNMMHTFRLLMSGESKLRNGSPIVRFGGESVSFLMKVRSGSYSYEELIDLVEEKVSGLSEFRDKSDLPEAPDLEAIETLLREATQLWQKNSGEE